MLIKAVNESRLLKTIISILLCLTVTAFTMMIKCIEVYAAFPFALPLFGFGLLFVIALLVMAGLTFESPYQATLAANHWYIDLKYGFPGISDIDREMALTDFLELYATSDAVKTVTDALWNFTKQWVSHWYDTGENNLNREVYAVVDENGEFVEYCFNRDDRVLLGDAILWNGDLFEWNYKGKSGGLYQYTLYMNGSATTYSVYCDYQDSPQFYVYASVYDELALASEYIRDNEAKWVPHSYGGFAYATPISGYEEQIQLARALNEDLDYNIAAIGAVDVVDNPAWDFETDEGERAIYVPTDGTIDNYIDITYDDLLTMTNEAVTDVPGMDDEEKTWWQDVIGGVSTKVQEVGQLITGTLADIKAWLEGANQSIISAVTTAAASIAEKIQAQEEEDIEPKAKQFKISDLFIIFLDVLKACIRLIIRACVYLATIVQIPQDGSLLNNDTQSGLDFIKNQTIPVINISLWDMYSGLMTLVISLAVVKRVRRTAEK